MKRASDKAALKKNKQEPWKHHVFVKKNLYSTGKVLETSLNLNSEELSRVVSFLHG